MGGRVGILDADVHGPSLPTMISPQPRVMIMDPATRVRPPGSLSFLSITTQSPQGIDFQLLHDCGAAGWCVGIPGRLAADGGLSCVEASRAPLSSACTTHVDPPM